jgi:predicted nucleic acid-binding Zn ribbon protein
MHQDKDDMRPLKEIIQGLFKNDSLPFNPEDGRIWKIWEEVVGYAIAKHAKPTWIRNGRLRVAVSGPVWLQELQFLEEGIRNKLNKSLGRQAVERIDFRLATR